MAEQSTHDGHCFCGTVQLRVHGESLAMGYCHCASCRSWSAGPVNAFTLWAPDKVEIIAGADDIGSFNKSPTSVRKWCKTCGGHLMTDHPVWGVVDVYAAILPDVAFKPSVHVNYGVTVLPMHDGLPKQADFPKELGGSGILLAE